MRQVLLLSFLLLALSGCVTLDEYIEIRRNGSAKIVLSYSISQEDLPLLNDADAVLNELAGQKQQGDMARIFDVEQMRKHFSGIEGIDIISLRTSEDDGRVSMYMNIQVEDFRGALRQGLLPYTTLEKAGSEYVFSASYPFNLSRLQPSSELLEVMNSLEVSFKVKTPTMITSTTALRKLANLAEWTYSPEGTPFSRTDGRFIVRFEAGGLDFLDEAQP